MPFAKKALCIGINYAGTDAELRGSVNDVLNMVRVLVNFLGFKRKNILAMIDEYPSGEEVRSDDENYTRPTKENMMEALSWLVQDVQPGDVVLFYYCGHGTSVPEALPRAGTDKLDDAIVPADWDQFDWGIVPYRLITDDVLHQYFSKIPGGTQLAVIMDCCVTGTFLDLPLRVDGEFPDREEENRPPCQGDAMDVVYDCSAWLQNQHVRALPRRLPHEPKAPIWGRMVRFFANRDAPALDEGVAVFAITASRQKQTSLDASLEGVSQGVLSYSMQMALELLNYKCTYLELFEKMNDISKRLRVEVMPYMNQWFQVAYSENATPDECLFLDGTSSFVAKDKARRRRGQRGKLRASR